MRAQRNLGEDIANVVLLDVHLLDVRGAIEVGINADPAEVLAEVLFNLQHFLVPFPKVQLPGAMLQNGDSPEQVFDGPRLDLGVIATDDLAEYKRSVTLQQVIDIMLKVNGVRAVSNVTLRDGGSGSASANGSNGGGSSTGVGKSGGPEVQSVELKPNEVPCLTPSIFEPPKNPYSITVQLEAGIIQPVDATRVYNEIQSRIAAMTDGQNYTELQTASLDYGRVPDVAAVDLAQYTSIQHQFPMTYGIGPDGMPALPNWRVESAPDAPPRATAVTLDRRRRQALAQQLKGYLLLFEQLLADHLAQLANAWKLFSLDLGPDARHSYFWQPLVHTPERETDPPDALMLLSQATGSDGTEQMQHGVYVLDNDRRVVLAGRETGNLTDAQAVRAEIARRGSASASYRIERIDHPELSASRSTGCCSTPPTAACSRPARNATAAASAPSWR